MMNKIGDYLEIHGFTVSTASAPTPERPDRAVIRAALRVKTGVRVLYMASLELDGMEMIESFRLTAVPECGEIPLPELFVFNPIRSREPGCGEYTVMLKVYASGGRVHAFSGKARFPAEPLPGD